MTSIYVPLKDCPQEGFAKLCRISNDLAKFMNIDVADDTMDDTSDDAGTDNNIGEMNNVATSSFCLQYIISYICIACEKVDRSPAVKLNKPLFKLFQKEIEQFGLNADRMKHQDVVKCLQEKISQQGKFGHSRTEINLPLEWKTIDKFEPVNVLLYDIRGRGQRWCFEGKIEEFRKRWVDLNLAPLQ